MPAALTRFEVQIPLSDDAAQQSAVGSFLTNLGGLTSYIANTEFVHSGAASIFTLRVYGHITSAQQAAALSLLNTLNAALGSPVLCVIFPVTGEP
jgi:hypothetical protein